MRSAEPDYAFGDDQAAAERLHALALLWEPLTAAFLREHAPRRPSLALDLGCGPGHTTRLLADTLAPTRTVGIDASAAYVEQARRDWPRLEFVEADATGTWPLPPPDAVYARFLLAHLSEPATRVGAWAAQLAPGGTLLIEDGVGMTTTEPACNRYLDLVRATFTAEGKELFPGASLAGLRGGSRWRVRHDGVAELTRPARRFAELFLPNVDQWGPRAVAAGVAAPADLDALREGLVRLLDEGDDGPVLTSRMRQLVVVRD